MSFMTQEKHFILNLRNNEAGLSTKGQTRLF